MIMMESSVPPLTAQQTTSGTTNSDNGVTNTLPLDTLSTNDDVVHHTMSESVQILLEKYSTVSVSAVGMFFLTLFRDIASATCVRPNSKMNFISISEVHAFYLRFSFWKGFFTWHFMSETIAKFT